MFFSPKNGWQLLGLTIAGAMFYVAATNSKGVAQITSAASGGWNGILKTITGQKR